MGDIYGLPAEPVVMGMAVGLAVLLILVLALWAAQRSLKRRIRLLLGGGEAATLESGIIRVHEEMKRLEENHRKQEALLSEMTEKLASIPSRSGLLRYNAFSEHGSDLSFSFALLNDNKDGVVLTGIHSREQTFIYAKPVEQGCSTYPLTPEEKKVIDQTERKHVSVPKQG